MLDPEKTFAAFRDNSFLAFERALEELDDVPDDEASEEKLRALTDTLINDAFQHGQDAPSGINQALDTYPAIFVGALNKWLRDVPVVTSRQFRSGLHTKARKVAKAAFLHGANSQKTPERNDETSDDDHGVNPENVIDLSSRSKRGGGAPHTRLPMPTAAEIIAQGKRYSTQGRPGRPPGSNRENFADPANDPIIRHLKAVWMPWIVSGELTRPELLARDPTAYSALGRWLAKEGNNLIDVLEGYDIPSRSQSARSNLTPQTVREAKRIVSIYQRDRHKQ